MFHIILAWEPSIWFLMRRGILTNVHMNCGKGELVGDGVGGVYVGGKALDDNE